MSILPLLSKIINADIPIVGPCKQVLSRLSELLDDEMKSTQINSEALDEWWFRIREWRGQHGLDHDQRHRSGANGSLLPQKVIQSIYAVTNGDAFVTSDVGQHQMFAAQYYKFPEPRRWINSGGLGTMGFGFPAAMGVQLAYPDARMVCITWEGSFMMNMQELSTGMQYGLPIKIINLNNKSLGMVKQWQDMEYGGRHSHSTYSDAPPDFIDLVESFGHVGYRANNLAELDAAVEETFSDANKGKLVFLDANIDPAEHVYPMSVRGGALKDMVLQKA